MAYDATMTLDMLVQKLRRLPDKRAFCRANGLPERTLWRLLKGGDPMSSTVAAFTAALTKQRSAKK